MPINPLCQVQDGAGPFVGTLNGVNVTAGNVISIQLSAPAGVVDWYLQVTGTDETSTPPPLTNVNPLDNKVATPTSTVTFSMPIGAGRAYLFQSTVTGPGGPLTTTFTVYVLTVHGSRVGSTGEQREGNATFGWTAIVNPLIRSGAPVLRYLDNLQAPASGANTVQGVIDWLKTQIGSGGGGPAPYISSLLGEYSAAQVPGFMEAPYYIDTSRTLTKVIVLRRKSGLVGESRVDVWRNGVSIYGGNPAAMPKVLAGADYGVAIDTPGLALSPGDIIEIRLDDVETFVSGPTPQDDGPEGLFVIVMFS